MTDDQTEAPYDKPDWREDPDPKAQEQSPHSFAEFRALGMLWLVNAAVFHPRGFSLAFNFPEEADDEEVLAGKVEPNGWYLFGDGTEAWMMSEQLNDDLFPKADGFLRSLMPDAAEYTEQLRAENARLKAAFDNIRVVVDHSGIRLETTNEDGTPTVLQAWLPEDIERAMEEDGDEPVEPGE